MRCLTAFALGIICLIAGGPLKPAVAQERLTVATLEDYAPFSDASRPDNGFSPDLLTIALTRAGYRPEVLVMPWARAVDGVREGRFDILTSVWKTPEREEFLAFTAAYATNRLVFAKPAASSFEFRTLEDLAGKTVGTVLGFAYDEAFMRADSFKRESIGSVLGNLRLVARGRIDLTIDDELLMRFILNTEGRDLKADIAFTQGALNENTLHMGVSRKRADAEIIARAFDRALAAMQADGTYDRLLEKHGMK